jgi:hypothetical protein
MNIRSAVLVFLACSLFFLGSSAHAIGAYVEIEKGDTYKEALCSYQAITHPCLLFKKGDIQYVLFIKFSIRNGDHDMYDVISEWIQNLDGTLTFVWKEDQGDEIKSG